MRKRYLGIYATTALAMLSLLASSLVAQQPRNQDGTFSRIKLEWSQNGGATFTPVPGLSPIPEEPGTVDAGTIDQPTVAVGANSVWVTWHDGTIKVRGAAVTGLGAIGAWTAEVHPPGADGQFGDIAIGPTGQVTVVSQDDVGSASTGTSNILVNTDPDGFGASPFGAAVLATTTNVSTFDVVPAQDDRSVDAEAEPRVRPAASPCGRCFQRSPLPRLHGRDGQREQRHEHPPAALHRRRRHLERAGQAQRRRDDEDAECSPNVHLDQSSGRLGVSWHDARGETRATTTPSSGAPSRAGRRHLRAERQDQCGRLERRRRPGRRRHRLRRLPWSDFHNGEFHPAWADDSNSTGDNPDGTTRFDIYTAKVTPGPTALTVLDLFARRRAGGAVAVSWRTAQETGVAGFDVFRTAAGRTVRVNRAVISARSNHTGAEYRIVDRVATRAAYRLRVLGSDGTRWWQGRATVAAPATMKLSAAISASPRLNGLFLATLTGRTLAWRVTLRGSTGRTSCPRAARLRGRHPVCRLRRPDPRDRPPDRGGRECARGRQGLPRPPLRGAAARPHGPHRPGSPDSPDPLPAGRRGDYAAGRDSLPGLAVRARRRPARARRSLRGALRRARRARADGQRDPKLPDVKSAFLPGVRDLTFALAAGDGVLLPNPEARRTVRDLTIVGRR